MNLPSAKYDLSAIARRAMHEHGLEPDFPADALQQLNAIGGAALVADNRSVRDLCSLLWCSIDNDESKDLDQLTVAERLEGGRIKVLVAIADVDALVKKGSPIDRHAYLNTTSVYTATVIFPMLPERLSTDLTSLGQNEKRSALIIELVANSDGTIESSTVYQAVVKNYAKLAYHSVAEWLDGKGPIPEKVAAVAGLDDQLRMQDEISQAMRKLRYLHGALDLELIAPRVAVTNGSVTDLKQEKQDRAQKLIEDFMIAANTATAKFLDKQGRSSLRRIVRSPERWDRIREVAHGYGVELPAEPDSVALAAFLAKRRAADPVRFPDLSLTVVKLMGAGEYVVQTPAEESEGHFGLAVHEYSHSTAPNRRFPDLVTQRLLKAALAAAPDAYLPAELSALATHCTEQEDAARKVERQVRKSAAALFLTGREGQTFDAIVTGASTKGTWVRLLQLPVEGKLTVGHEKIDVGDKLHVRLQSLNVERGFIDFVGVNKT